MNTTIIIIIIVVILIGAAIAFYFIYTGSSPTTTTSTTTTSTINTTTGVANGATGTAGTNGTAAMRSWLSAAAGGLPNGYIASWTLPLLNAIPDAAITTLYSYLYSHYVQNIANPATPNTFQAASNIVSQYKLPTTGTAFD